MRKQVVIELINDHIQDWSFLEGPASSQVMALLQLRESLERNFDG